MTALEWMFLDWLGKYAIGCVALLTVLHLTARRWRKRGRRRMATGDAAPSSAGFRRMASATRGRRPSGVA